MATDLPAGWTIEHMPGGVQAASPPDPSLPEGWTVESMPQQQAAPVAAQGPFGMPMPSSQGATPSSLALNYGAGTNEAVSATLGAPADITAWLLNRGADAINFGSRQVGGSDLLGHIENPFGGAQSIRDAQGAVYGGSPDQIVPQNAPERIARGAGFGTAAAILPGAEVGALGRIGAISPRAAEIGSLVTGTPSAGNVAIGATAGGSGAGAAEAVPDQWKPLANLVGGLVGGGALAGLGALGSAGWNAAKNYLAPVRAAGQQDIAARVIQGAATDPAAVRASVAEGAQQIVPGSVPTTAQQTGDMGLLSMERNLQNQRPDLFRGRAAEQNTARTAAVRGLETAGDPADVTRLVRAQLGAIDAATEAAVTQARTQADTAAANLGGTRPVEAYGSTIRDAAVTAEAAARAAEGRLWRAVDPDGSLALNVTPVREAAKEIAGAVTRSARPMSGDEAQIFGAARSYQDVMPFREITDLRSNLSAAMRNELRTNGRTQTYGRLSGLRGAVEDTISTAVERQAQQQAEAVARGEMAPDETFLAKWQREAQEFQDRRAAEARMGQSGAAGVGADGSSGPGGFSAAYGAQSQGGRGFRDASGNPGVPEDPGLTPNFDADAAARLAAASAATKERATTFGPQTPSGAVVRNAEGRDAYRLSDAAVPGRVFHPGPRGYEDVQQYRAAVGDAQALPVLADYAASILRRAAGRPDGSLDPARIAVWQKANSEAMRAFPELQARFGTVADAERSVLEAAAARRDALDNFNHQAAAKLLNLQAPSDVARTIGGMFSNRNAASAFMQLKQATAASPEAQAGVRRAIVDYIAGRFIGNTEVATSGEAAIKSDQFQTFVRQNRPALAQFFTADEIASMQAVAADLQRANRSLVAAKIPGQSNTAQDLAAGTRNNLHDTVLQRLVTGGVGLGAGHLVGGPIGSTAGFVGTVVLSAMRDAGLRKVDDLVVQAMLDPVLARTLLRRVSNAEMPSAAQTLAQRLRTISVVGTLGTPRKTRGGR